MCILWKTWGVRMLTLLSLCLQIILTIFGKRRKSTSRRMAGLLIWAAYLTAEWVATTVLDNLSDKNTHAGDEEKSVQIIWAPMLLLHLGSPDTITSYSLEDNELWLKGFFDLLIQIKVLCYVLAQYFKAASFMAVLTLLTISGVIKYGERNWARKCSSLKYFESSLPSQPDPCPEFGKYIEQATRDNRLEDRDLVQALYLFKRFEFFLVGLTLSKDERTRVYSIIRHKNSADAFKLVEIELEFMYDLLYTKANIVYSRLGIFLRCITFFCSLSALLFYLILYDIKRNYDSDKINERVDKFLTYLLLIMAVLLEIYALIVLLFSDWTKLWLIKLVNTPRTPISKALVNQIWRFNSLCHLPINNKKRWSKSIGQYNLISSCLRCVQPTACSTGVRKLPFLGELSVKKFHLTREDAVVEDIKEMIFRYIKEQGCRFNEDDHESSIINRNSILARRGNFALEARHDFKEKILWSIFHLDFIDSLIIWHISTDLLYYDDLHHRHGDDNVCQLNAKCKISKCFSDYIMYLLVFHPSMLPKNLSKIRRKQTCDEIERLLKEWRDDDLDENKAREGLYQNHLQRIEDGPLDGMLMAENDSLLKYGCELAKQLRTLMEIHGQEVTWEVISEIWVEMTCYAAHNCKWQVHAKHLSKGGELLTHVCLLMAHFGLSKQFVDNQWIPFSSEEPPEDHAEVWFYKCS